MSELKYQPLYVEVDRTPEYSLWMEVLNRGIRDCLNYDVNYDIECCHHQNAMAWLGTYDFKWICEQLDIDHKYLKAWILQQKKNKVVWDIT